MLAGVYYFPTDYGIDIAELARALEERGYDALFVCEHTHIPLSRRTPFPGGGELPKKYKHTHDPFVALSFAAAATRTLKLGTGICLVPQRDPIITAKAVASLDQLSNGRFIFAMGGGWNVVREHHLEKEFPFPDFAGALAFTNRVGALAEEQGHHPDIYLAWGKVRITIWTHKIDGLTRSDFVLAAKIDRLG